MANWNDLQSQQKNELVARKIMGWQPVQCDGDVELTVYDDGDAWCPRCHAREHINSFDHDIIPSPAYTRSMDAAWSVLHYAAEHFEDGSAQLERLAHALGGTFEIEEKTGCYEYTDYPLWELLDISHWTPESICRAVLIGLGVLDEQGNLIKEGQNDRV